MAFTALLSSSSRRPLVSIIVPTYNYGRYIGQTLGSILAQTYREWECVVVDDGSTDNTSEVVAEYAKSDARIRYIYQRNQKQSVAKNTGIINTTGEYLQFLDADDLIESQKLEVQVGYLECNAVIDIVYGSVRYFSIERTDERLFSMWGDNKLWMPEISGEGVDILQTLVRQNIMVLNSPLIRRSVVSSVGYFDEVLPPAEDWDYWIRCAARGKRFQFMDAPNTLALVRYHPLSSSQNRWQMHASTLLMRKKIPAYVSNERILKLNRRCAAQDEASLGVEELNRGSSVRGGWRFLRAGLLEQRLKWRAKYIGYALLSFVKQGKRLQA